MPIKLNIGGGGKPIDGYTEIDRKSGQEAYPLTFADNSVDEVRASHVLEHFSHRKTVDVLKEWVRVLKHGGVIKIAVPDFDKVLDLYESDSSKYPIEGFIMGGQTDKDDYHGAIFNRDKLELLMTSVGISDIKEWKSEIADCATIPISLNLCGKKADVTVPKPSPERITGVMAIMSMPRIAFTDNMFCAMEGLIRLGIPIQRQSGVFWGQCLTRLFEMNMDAHEFLLTVDYDTVYTKEDVEALYQIIATNPEVDAVCATQMRRGYLTPLMTIRDEHDKPQSEVLADEFDKEITKIASGHFGLTLIRTSALNKLPKPWFMPVPDKNGGWNDGRIDEDVNFWFNFRNAGLNLFNANRVVVGHFQSLITWPSKELTPVHQFPNDYQSSGAPVEVRR